MIDIIIVVMSSQYSIIVLKLQSRKKCSIVVYCLLCLCYTFDLNNGENTPLKRPHIWRRNIHEMYMYMLPIHQSMVNEFV